MVGTVMKMSDTLRIVRTVSNAFDELSMVGTVRKLFLMRLGEGWSQH
jgi:3-phosphoglycerate kinase